MFRDPLLLCTALYFLLCFDASGWLRLSLWAAFLHEAGHIAVYFLQMHRMPVIEVTLTGFCMRVCQTLTARQRFWLAAAGPAMNFFLAAVWTVRLEQQATIRGSAFWAANVLTGMLNLIPVQPLDGAQMLECAQKLCKQQKKNAIKK